MLVPTAAVILLQSDLLRLAIDAHVQKRHALRKCEVELESAAAAVLCAVRESGRGPRSVADDVPLLGGVDISFHDAARCRLSSRIFSVSDDHWRLVAVCVWGT